MCRAADDPSEIRDVVSEILEPIRPYEQESDRSNEHNNA